MTASAGLAAAAWGAAALLARPLPRTWSWRRPRRRRGAATPAERRDAVAQLCDGLAAALRAGLPPSPAVAAVHDAGLTATVGWLPGHPVPARVPPGAEGLAWLATAWALAEQAGLATAVEGVGDAVRASQEAADAAAAALAPARATARLLGVLPALGVVAGTVMGAHPLAVLLGTPVGWGCLLVGGSLQLAGWRWTSALGRRAEVR